jgi:hypothetical protein
MLDFIKLPHESEIDQLVTVLLLDTATVRIKNHGEIPLRERNRNAFGLWFLFCHAGMRERDVSF